jgi:hypothetical protein
MKSTTPPVVQPARSVPPCNLSGQSNSARLSSTSGVAQPTLAFFGGMNDCNTLSTLAHPCIARNSRLLDAWVQWSRMFEGTTQECLAEQLMASPRRRFDQNTDLIESMVQQDPFLRAGRFEVADLSANMRSSYAVATAGVMYWQRKHALLQATPALEELLSHSDLGDDLPVSCFRPPFAACYIQFGDTLRRCINPAPSPESSHDNNDSVQIQGAYVFESVREEARTIAILPIVALLDRGKNGCSQIELVINDETRPLNQLIHGVCSSSPELGAHFVSVAQVVAKVFLYMEQPSTVQIEERPYTQALEQLQRRGAKKSAKLSRQLPKLYDRIILGPRETPGHGHGELATHLRRGHFRLQSHGPKQSLRKVMFIAPTWVRPDRLAHA